MVFRLTGDDTQIYLTKDTRATDLEHTLEAMWAGLDGDGRMLVYIFALWLMGAIVIMVGGRR